MFNDRKIQSFFEKENSFKKMTPVQKEKWGEGRYKDPTTETLFEVYKLGFVRCLIEKDKSAKTKHLFENMNHNKMENT